MAVVIEVVVVVLELGQFVAHQHGNDCGGVGGGSDGGGCGWWWG